MRNTLKNDISLVLQNKAIFPAIFALQLITIFASAQTTNYDPSGRVNYVRTWDFNKPNKDIAEVFSQQPVQLGIRETKQTTVYYDGLGRLVQTVVKEGSTGISNTNKYDFVSTSLYDELGREQYKHNAFQSFEGNGDFKFDPFQQQANFMQQQYGGQGENYFYSQTIFEASPLNRVEKSLAPGNNWVGQNRGVEVKYWTNTIADEVRIWNVTDNPGSFGTYSTTAIYPAGELYKTVTIDEHQKQLVEFKDKEGRVILKKVQFSAPNDGGSGQSHSGWLCTYYIYDDLGNLRCVIQPRGVELLSTLVNWDIHTTGDALANEQCFRYEYDQRNRLVMKKVPGADVVYMIYDARDRLVMTQDGKMRQDRQWMVTSYDDINRPVSTHLITDITHYNDFVFHYSNAYSSSSYPLLSQYPSELIAQTAYDDYGSYSNYADFDNSDIGSYLYAASETAFPYPVTSVKSDATKGVLTP